MRNINSVLERPRGKSQTPSGNDVRRSTDQSAQTDGLDVIEAYGALMARRRPLPTRIEDTSALPFPKEKILHALIVELARGHTERLNASLKLGALSLAQYQPCVGEKPLEALGVDISKSRVMNNFEALRAEAKRSVSAETEAARQRYLAFNILVKADLARIRAKIAAAEAKDAIG